MSRPTSKNEFKLEKSVWNSHAKLQTSWPEDYGLSLDSVWKLNKSVQTWALGLNNSETSTQIGERSCMVVRLEEMVNPDSKPSADSITMTDVRGVR